jgi:hypothetical protein
VICQPSGTIPGAAAGLLFRATQYSAGKLTGSRRYSRLTWPCPGCGRQVTDRAATGRPVRAELGRAPGCAWPARDWAVAEGRPDRLLRLILHSARGPVQRHWLGERFTDDCPALRLARILPPLHRDRRRRLERCGLRQLREEDNYEPQEPLEFRGAKP